MKLFIFATVILSACVSEACYTMVVGKEASASGKVMVAHNEDDYGELEVFRCRVPARDHRADATVPAESGKAIIPQVAHTWAFDWTGVRRKNGAGGLGAADTMLNEKGVLVVSNNGNGIPDDDPARLTDGGLIHTLRRAVAERATSARDAVSIITNLVTTWGYAHTGRMYTVADRDEAWIVSIVHGREFVARRCPGDQVALVPNCFKVSRLEPGDIVSPRFAKAGPDDDFAKENQDPKHYRIPNNQLRDRVAAQLLTGKAWAADAAVDLRVGFGTADITPAPGTLMPGYFKVREMKGVLDPLEALCVAFSDGKDRALLMAIDCVDMPDAFADEVRAQVARETGVNPQAMLVHATHTHTGGDLRRKPNRLLDAEAGAVKCALSRAYAVLVQAALLRAAKDALADLKPARLSGARSVAKRTTFGRRYRMKDGTVRTNPGVLNPDIVGPAGTPPDDSVQVLRIDREGADPVAIINFQTHPDVIGGERVSADWPGLARRAFSSALDGRVRTVLVNGTEGDVNHVCVDPTPEERQGLQPDFDDVPRGYVYAQRMGSVLSAAALQVWRTCEPYAAGPVRFGAETIRVPSNRPKPEEMAEARRIDALHRAGKDAELPYKGMDLTTFRIRTRRAATRLNRRRSVRPLRMI